jgi:hypothetical protein
MAKTIEPISSWQNGEEKQATVFVLTSSFDNLSTSATFQYQLNEVVTAPMPPYPSPFYPMLNGLVNSSLNISGQDYMDWDAASDANEWAYNWAATQLKLVITGEYVPTYPTTTTTTIVPTTTLAP